MKQHALEAQHKLGLVDILSFPCLVTRLHKASLSDPKLQLAGFLIWNCTTLHDSIFNNTSQDLNRACALS